MFVGTGGALWAMPLHVGFAYWPIGRDAVTIGLEEEGREAECELRCLMREDLSCEVAGIGAVGNDPSSRHLVEALP